MNEQTQPAIAGQVDRHVRPVAEVKSARLRWHLPTPDADPVAKFLDNQTHPLYDQDALDAAVAAERERCARLCDEAEDVTLNAREAELARKLAAAIRGPNAEVTGAARRADSGAPTG